MKKLLTFCLLLAAIFTVNAQTKEETLTYIKVVYSQINQVYSNSNTYYSNVQQLDSVKLEHDNLVFYFTIFSDDKKLKLVKRAKISGEIKSGSYTKGLINNKGDEFMQVRSGNNAQLERLKNAVIHLQKFITKDPFAN